MRYFRLLETLSNKKNDELDKKQTSASVRYDSHVKSIMKASRSVSENQETTVELGSEKT